MKNGVTVGADPELFLSDTRTGSFYPACGLFGGTKDEPLASEGGAILYHEDNVTLELGWGESKTLPAFLRRVLTAQNVVQTLIREKCPEYVSVCPAPSALFSDLSNVRGADEFGCSPDYDAYAQGAQCKSFTSRRFKRDEGDWRFAGGHIHIGYDKDQGVPEYVAAMLCDVYLTLPTLSVDPQGLRRRYYGRPGRYRPKPYGLEYRTPSSYWFFSSALAEVVGYNAFALGKALSDEETIAEMVQQAPWLHIREVIRNEDSKAAGVILDSLANMAAESGTGWGSIRRV